MMMKRFYLFIAGTMVIVNILTYYKFTLYHDPFIGVSSSSATEIDNVERRKILVGGEIGYLPKKKVKAIVPNFRASVAARIVDMDRFNDLGMDQMVYPIEKIGVDRFEIISPFTNRSIIVQIPYNVEDNWKEMGLLSSAKVYQTYHVSSILSDSCNVCKSNNDPKDAKLPYFLVDDDVTACPDAQAYFQYILNYFEENYKHISMIRMGVGSNGILFGCKQMCRFAEYFKEQIHLSELQLLRKGIIIDGRKNNLTLSSEEDKPNKYLFGFDELLDYFFMENTPDAQFLTFHHNLLSHNNSAESTVLNQDFETLLYGECYQKLYSINLHRYTKPECSERAFHPCEQDDLRKGMTIVPPLLKEQPPVTMCGRVTLEEFDNLVVKYGYASCDEVCKTGEYADERYVNKTIPQGGFKCNPKFMGLVGSIDFLQSLDICEKTSLSIGKKVSLKRFGPIVKKRFKKCYPRAFPCFDVDNFCKLESSRAGSKRICPCSV